MHDYLKAYQSYLDKKCTEYTAAENVIVIPIIGEHGPFGTSVSFRNMSDDYLSIQHFAFFSKKIDTGEKHANAILLCNQQNAELGWGRFHTINNQIFFSHAVLVRPSFFDFSHFCEYCSNLHDIMVNLVDDAYPKFMKVL